MLKKIYNKTIANIKENYKSYILFIVFILLIFIKFDYNIYSNGGLSDLTNRIKVENAYKSAGSFNLTYVTSRRATMPLILLSYIIPSWDLINVDESRIDNEKESDINTRNKIYLKDTSYDAIIAAFTEAQMEYIIKNIDLTITHVFDYAKTNLRTGDIIKKINEASVKTYEELSEELAKYTSGEKLNIIVSRNNKTTACYAQLSTKENNVVIGISLLEVKEVETTPTVKYIFKNNESGSSRGLLCALDIYDKLTIDDLTKGDIIAGTGSINEKGEVGAVDGIKYKLAGAVKKKADVFIVPTENYEEAINIKNKNKYTIEIIEADNLHNVIEKLKQRN